jgi:hypothetical protein
MEHLYSSVVKVQRLVKSNNDGVVGAVWTDQAAPLAAIRCRLDLNFLRPGKDAPQAYEAGTAPDRIGILFCSASIPLRAGDRIVTVSGPVTGVFDIRATPDVAPDYSSGHHIEVQIIESVQKKP